MGTLFPSDAASLRATANEIGLSRVYGGIHYRFDIDTGAALGKRVAGRAMERDVIPSGLLGVLR